MGKAFRALMDDVAVIGTTRSFHSWSTYFSMKCLGAIVAIDPSLGKCLLSRVTWKLSYPVPVYDGLTGGNHRCIIYVLAQLQVL